VQSGHEGSPMRRFCHDTKVVRFLVLTSVLAVVGSVVGPVFGQSPAAGKKYALLVGVRNYKKSELTSLQFTENDVNDLAQVLQDAGYRRVVVMTQTEANKDASRLPIAKNIRDQLQGLLEDRKPEDSVLVAFSGHGVQLSGDRGHFFCAMDTE